MRPPIRHIVSDWLHKFGVGSTNDEVIKAAASHLANDTSVVFDERSLPFSKRRIIKALNSELRLIAFKADAAERAGMGPVAELHYRDREMHLKNLAIYIDQYHQIDPSDRSAIKAIEDAGGFDRLAEQTEATGVSDRERAMTLGLLQVALSLQAKYRSDIGKGA